MMNSQLPSVSFCPVHAVHSTRQPPAAEVVRLTSLRVTPRLRYNFNLSAKEALIKKNSKFFSCAFQVE